jgi:hypothetical protein
MWNSAQALQEGWDVFDVDGRCQLQRLDDPSSIEALGYNEPKFASDTDAIIYVALRAHEGSAYHRDALDLVGELAESTL